MQLQDAIRNVFAQLSVTLSDLSAEEYTKPCVRLSHNTIGQHVRHIIELFQCLEAGYDQGTVNYENRRRDRLIETDKEVASELLVQISGLLNRADKEMILEATYSDHSDNQLRISTNFFREVAYNLEHTIHHMALIRVGVEEVSALQLSETFGVASSTVKHRSQCAQ
jgi:hypothetical protein